MLEVQCGECPTNNILKIITVSTLSIAIVCFVLVISVVMICVVTTSEVSDKPTEYQLFQYDSVSNEGSFGFVTSPKKLSQYEYLSYDNSEGFYNLISNLGEEEFICHGNCYCENDEYEERRTTSVLSKGVLYLLTASSVVVANSLAKNHFESQCVQSLSSSCDPGNVRSEVGDCENAREVTVTKEGKDGKEIKTYRCKGGCMPTLQSIKEKRNHLFDCKSLQTEGIVTIPNIGKYSWAGVFKANIRPHTHFSVIYLTSFCWENKNL